LEALEWSDGRNSSWGDETTLFAISRVYKRIVYAVQVNQDDSNKVDAIHVFSPPEVVDAPLWLKQSSSVHFRSLRGANAPSTSVDLLSEDVFNLKRPRTDLHNEGAGMIVYFES
jgi:hypothetical protein